jgi:hypothetical protein
VAKPTVVTPTVRATGRRALFWIVAAVFVLIVAVVALAITGSASGTGTPYSATDAGPSGSKALAQVLAQHGIRVAVPGTLAAARSALRGSGVRGGGATLVLVDPNDYLGASQLRTLAGLTARVVLIEPSYTQLEQLAPGVVEAGEVGNRALAAGCALEAARRAGTISGVGIGYRVTADAVSPVDCFGSGRSTFSVVESGAADHRVTVVGAGTVFSNEHVIDRGNAALALGVLGRSDRLVWYLPTIDDAAASGNPTIGQLTPLWVSPVVLLLIIAAIAAAVWRGRRMGPLVIENLPVIVRARETMEGRARLYQRGGARLHALDTLRIGTLGRLAATCGLSRRATADEIASTVAVATGRELGGIRALLLDASPATDRELVDLSDRLLELERATASAVRPSVSSSKPQRQPQQEE